MAGLADHFSQKLPSHLKNSLEATKCEYRRLGNSGLKALPILKAAYDRGLNTWDTSNNYSNGGSERIIAKAIKEYRIPRDKLVILTKCFGTVGEDPSFFTPPYTKHVGASLSRKAILHAVNGSLARLETDYIDLLQIHRFDYETPIEETLSTLHDLVTSGKVRYIGASSMWTYQFAMMQACAKENGWTRFVSMQNHYHLLYREEEREMIKYCQLSGVGLIPWSPLCRGHLARPRAEMKASTRGSGEAETPIFGSGTADADATIIDRVQELAEQKGWKMSQVALAWINKRVTSPIIGFSSVGRIDEAIDARGKALSDAEERFLEELYVPKGVQGHV
ncbi:MAG: hypothetical protein Q9191_003932 [Dirinaria sp. TL-2023a]